MGRSVMAIEKRKKFVCETNWNRSGHWNRTESRYEIQLDLTDRRDVRRPAISFWVKKTWTTIFVRRYKC